MGEDKACFFSLGLFGERLAPSVEPPVEAVEKTTLDLAAAIRPEPELLAKTGLDPIQVKWREYLIGVHWT